MDIDFEANNFTHGNFSIEDYTINYVSIPVGTKLYHGNNFEEGNDILVGDLKYFLINPEHAFNNQYGIMHEFETTIPLNLIRLDNKDTQNYLYETSGKEIQTILERNFGYKNSIRESRKETDATVARFICELCKDSDYHGYLTDVMDTDMGGTFHPEIVICNPLDKLNFVKTATPLEDRSYIRMSMEDKYKRADKKKRKSKPSYDHGSPDGSPEEKSIASDPLNFVLASSYDSPPNSPAEKGLRLFEPATPGGKKSKKKNLKKKGNKRKTKRKSSKNKRKRANK